MTTESMDADSARNLDLHTGEKHLGGYIPAKTEPTPSGLNREHGDPATWSPKLWTWAYETLMVRSVLDVGCGEGHCAVFFRELGCEVAGIDGSQEALRHSVIPDTHVVHDYVTGPYAPNRRYDLIWSCEFVEHVEERYCSNFLETFDRAGSKLLMLTHAVPGQPGWHHVNCQPGSYWVAQMLTCGFVLDQPLTLQARAVSEPGHFRARGLVFVRESC